MRFQLLHLRFGVHWRILFFRFFGRSACKISKLHQIELVFVVQYWYAGPGALGFFSIAPWSSNFTLTQANHRHLGHTKMIGRSDRISSMVRVVYARTTLCVCELRLQIRTVVQVDFCCFEKSTNAQPANRIYVRSAAPIRVDTSISDGFKVP